MPERDRRFRRREAGGVVGYRPYSGTRISGGTNPSVQDPMLPPGYYLDESDPDIITLRRKDGTFVAAFSAQGATRSGIVEAALQDSKSAEATDGSASDGDTDT